MYVMSKIEPLRAGTILICKYTDTVFRVIDVQEEPSDLSLVYFYIMSLEDGKSRRYCQARQLKEYFRSSHC